MVALHIEGAIASTVIPLRMNSPTGLTPVPQFSGGITLKGTVNAPNGTLKCSAMMLIALQVFAGLPQSAYAQTAAPATTTPIKHVIVIIGENRTFDHVYGTYKPKEGETISNLLSKGIVKANGEPGANYSRQYGLGRNIFQQPPVQEHLQHPSSCPRRWS
jgi:phospholipase C